MANALVTGGAGFIGSHLVRALLARGDRVLILDNLSTGFEESLSGLDVEMVEGDIRDERLMRECMEGIDHVFHLAAMISVPASMEDPAGAYDVNLMGSLNVLTAAQATGVSGVVLASSAAVYGETTGRVSESSPTAPMSPYAASKLAMEHVARLFATAYRLPTTSLRFFNVYGPRQSPDSPYAAAIPLFIGAMLAGRTAQIFGDGEQTRDFVFIEDVVQANLLAIEKMESGGGVYNIGGGGSVSVLELVHTLQRILSNAPPPEHVPPRPGDIRFSEADIKMAEQALGYRPTIDLLEGLKSTIQWFQARERKVE
jgi:UDP-glucose 4-epimerase